MPLTLVPAYILCAAAPADAEWIVSSHLIRVNHEHGSQIRILMCENSPSTEVDERNPPTSLDDHPTHAHTAALNAARTANAELLRDLQQLLASHAKVLEVLDVLVDECGTNADFADEHDSEVEALGRAETASSTARTLQQQLAARVAA